MHSPSEPEQGKTYDAQATPLAQPSPEDIKRIRGLVGLTQQQAAELVHRASGARWREWEGGKYNMDLAVWELFLIKTGLRSHTGHIDHCSR